MKKTTPTPPASRAVRKGVTILFDETMCVVIVKVYRNAREEIFLFPDEAKFIAQTLTRLFAGEKSDEPDEPEES